MESVDNAAQIEAAVAKATSEEEFDFLESVNDRSYPEFNVAVYLDEKKVQALIELSDERALVENSIANSAKPSVEIANRFEEIDGRYQKLVDELRTVRYVVTVRGISPEKALALEDEAYAKFPREFDEVVNPQTGITTKTEKESDERNEYLATSIRQAHIAYVTSPKGAVDRKWDNPEKVKKLWIRLPFVSRIKLDEAVQNCTIAVDYYRELVDEVF